MHLNICTRVLDVAGAAFEGKKRNCWRRASFKKILFIQKTTLHRTSIKQVYDESHGIYGSYKIADRLKDDDSLEAACRNTVATAMREMALKSKVSKKFSPTTTVSDPAKAAAPNVLNQSFKADAPNRKWVTDITYLPTADGWVYLTVVLVSFPVKKIH